MQRLRALVLKANRDESGATAIEYGLVAGLVSITIITWATQIGLTLNGFFAAVAAVIVGP